MSVDCSASWAETAEPPRWYVAQTQPHREFGAERQLAAQGFKTFLPTHWKTTRHARAFRTAKAPLFPGYLFVELALGRDRWRSVNGTFGVSRMIMAGELPQPVPAGVVEALLALRDSTDTVSFGDQLRPGQRRAGARRPVCRLHRRTGQADPVGDGCSFCSRSWVARCPFRCGGTPWRPPPDAARRRPRRSRKAVSGFGWFHPNCGSRGDF